MNYLKYIELSAENLQFFLWHRDYSNRFNDLPENQKGLAPEWKNEEVEPENQPRQKRLSPEDAAVFKGTDFADERVVGSEAEKSNPFFTPPRTPTSESRREGDSMNSFDESMTSGGGRVNHTKRASGAFESAGLKWKPRKLQSTIVSYKTQLLISQ